MLDKNFDAASVEPRIAKIWDDANAFAAGAGAKEGADPYCIVIPPPNVTGSLHMGHALNNTLQDVMIRYQRMNGRNVLWQPGMDHAGIATQMVVERQMAENGENVTRRDLGREKFVERIWQWKNESGGRIFNQLKRLGASCDWSRERFTMDEGLSKAVLEVFVRLYREGLIYKDKRLVNWDPKLHTAISDLEVEQREVDGHLWHFRYPLADGETYEHPYNLDDEGNRTGWKPSDGEPAGYETRDYLVVATTRPETMLGDTGVAVHPDDPRYKKLVGKHVILPIVGRRIPIVADEYPDPEAGTGAVKMTPAHDFNDFEVGKRQNLPAINVLDEEACISLKGNADFHDGLEQTAELADATSALDGLDRFVAREKIVEMMDNLGLLDRIEPHRHQVPHGDRGGVPIEPYLTDQWYVDAATLAKPAIASVREGRTQFVPKNWENTYFNWMENIQPWCISRQLWWGHQIPAWYGPDGKVFVEKSEEEAAAAAKAHYGKEVELTRDEDVLDTWFSSALWPFSTLGWPDQTEALKTWYPTNVLVTGFDIIFFWVARMMMMGLHFMKDENGMPVEPFHTVYVHALVRDKFGQKMSKSKGNVIDPLELIDEYGADALRFTLAIMAAQGRDVKLDPARIAGYRNFGTKLWNATRFAQMNGVRIDPSFRPEHAKLQINRWILTEFTKAAREVAAGIDQYRFNEAANAVYRFVWNTFCDWYLELLKPLFNGEDEEAKAEAQACAAHVLDGIYKLLHPFMPFMTEELWALTADQRDTLLCHAEWPRPEFEDAEAAGEINWLIELVSGIRSTRAEMNVPASANVPLVVVGAGDATRQRLLRHDPAIKRLARVEDILVESDVPKGSAQIIVGEATACLPLGGLIDVEAERARLAKASGKIEAEIRKLESKLGNEKFLANAKPEVVAKEKEKLQDALSERDSLQTAMQRLEQIG
ncbi:valine--tRNA ligase [Oricola thermophila]|uniref:Valine--tRNA ligase n=1 Tax=Oricola thermophila TaxID=2742145 RepID=A0A6N1VF29_9HYPH|nr:valine--tRNA ligase [Oricola thermophila]QKV17739.1 valine--tRNA ligase [Oricola thermophila]